MPEDIWLRSGSARDAAGNDPLGKALPKHSGEYLLEVILRRYENRSTIMTTVSTSLSEKCDDSNAVRCV